MTISSNESESGICMIICCICCDICCARGPYQGPAGRTRAPADRTRAPWTSIPPPPHSRTSVQRPSRAFGPRGLFPFFFIFARGGPPGHVAASHTAFAVFAVWAVRPCTYGHKNRSPEVPLRTNRLLIPPTDFPHGGWTSFDIGTLGWTGHR